MGRIRTIKPEFFLHADLYEAEAESGLPCRVAFAGLFTVCDREGRFKWRPRELKAQVLPYDEGVDFDKLLTVLQEKGFIERYHDESDPANHYGCIISWKKHQIINSREAQSKLPSIDSDTCRRVGHAWGTRHGNAHARTCMHKGKGTGKEGKGTGTGREGKGKGKELEGKGVAPQVCDQGAINNFNSHDQTPSDEVRQEGNQAKSPEVEELLSPVTRLNRARNDFHKLVYGVAAVNNAKSNGQLSTLFKNLGEKEALEVLEWFYTKPNNYYRMRGHDLGLLLLNLDALATEVRRKAPIIPDHREKTLKAELERQAADLEVTRYYAQERNHENESA